MIDKIFFGALATLGLVACGQPQSSDTLAVDAPAVARATITKVQNLINNYANTGRWDSAAANALYTSNAQIFGAGTGPGFLQTAVAGLKQSGQTLVVRTICKINASSPGPGKANWTFTNIATKGRTSYLETEEMRAVWQNNSWKLTYHNFAAAERAGVTACP